MNPTHRVTRSTDFEWVALDGLKQIVERLLKENLTPGECLLEWRVVRRKVKK